MPKRSRSPIRDTKESLSYLTRKQLQAKAKSMGIKANMKSETIINAIVELLREAEKLEEDAASPRRTPTTTRKQQPQVATPVATGPSDEDPFNTRRSRSRTRLAEHKTTIPSNPGARSPTSNNDAGRPTPIVETREAKRRRVEIEEAQRLAAVAKDAAEQARVAKQRADVALAAIKRLDEGMPRALGQTLYEREPSPIEQPADATPVPSRGPSPAEFLPIIHAPDDLELIGNPVVRPLGAYSLQEAEQKRLADRAQAQLEEEDDADKENDACNSDEEGNKENRSPPVSRFLPASSKDSSILERQSPSQVTNPVPSVAGSISSVHEQPQAAASHPLTNENIRDALRRLTETSLKIEDIQKKVDRSEVTIHRMKNTAREGAKIIEANFGALAALESNLLKHVKRNPAILDGNGFDDKNGGAAREERLRRAYYSQQKKDREESEAKEAEKARKKREEQAIREAAEANKEALEEGSSGSSDGSLELDPSVIALISAGGDLGELMGMQSAREEEEGQREDDEEEYETEDSSEDEEQERPSDGSATPPRITWKRDTVRFNTSVRVQWEMEGEGEDGEYKVTRFSN